MRGEDLRTGELFSYVDLEARVRRDHLAGDPGDRECWAGRSVGGFQKTLRGLSRPSLAPEKLLRAMLLQAFTSSARNGS
jgi:hypothetical protein